MEEGNIEELSLNHNCFSQEHVFKIESEALVSTSDFCPVLTKSTVSWERSIVTHKCFYLNQVLKVAPYRFFEKWKIHVSDPKSRTLIFC